MVQLFSKRGERRHGVDEQLTAIARVSVEVPTQSDIRLRETVTALAAIVACYSIQSHRRTTRLNCERDTNPSQTVLELNYQLTAKLLPISACPHPCLSSHFETQLLYRHPCLESLSVRLNLFPYTDNSVIPICSRPLRIRRSYAPPLTPCTPPFLWTIFEVRMEI